MQNPLMRGFRPPMARRTPMMSIQQIQQMYQEVKSNPVQFARNHGYNIPDGESDSFGVLQHLAQSGQFGQQQMQMYNQAMAQYGQGKKNS